uniref:Uncharacterized protein n=1 Tax=Candidatus Kentrum sp. TUN TaxID=2126343 RepID=A0A451ALJ2_9GAMM|nr:MAG: hypothetical protein BECKTUN1418F_GA0071002_11306 [Candidatus Kentron sp. TUN]VFK59390.1 MAG: hypothetical protein BECKTUN1418D_GA0071000_11015 [Candidatus Kentron sp. TUN]VFK66896.1 MAG: hypothetical protein BECKTUN1418E_GA0071001_11266 [Candidatus Kentron sp. TUN]
MENLASSANNTRQVQAVFRGHMILEAFSKLSRYQAECRLFEKKYGASFDSVKQDKRGQGAEDFMLEDDLLDWEYARAARQWWQEITGISRCIHSYRRGSKSMATLNLPLEDNLLQRAQSRAAAQGTTVDALLQGFLQNYAHKSVACQQATRNILQLARESRMASDSPRWTRESLYER